MKKIFFVLVVCLVSFSSCKKKEGCTDSSALNFDNTADKDDGSCTYKGSITFWTASSSFGVITVNLNGTSALVTSYYTGVPSCSANGCATFQQNPGDYYFTASDGSTSWSGMVHVGSKGCNTLQLY